MNESVSLREHLERRLDDYTAAHSREHVVHAEAHDREHSLNKEAIDKAESSVDRAVSAARDTVGADMGALEKRLEHAEEEYRRRADEQKAELHQINLTIVTLTRQAEVNAKGIQSIQDSVTWLVRIVAGAIVVALLALIFKPGLF